MPTAKKRKRLVHTGKLAQGRGAIEIDKYIRLSRFADPSLADIGLSHVLT